MPNSQAQAKSMQVYAQTMRQHAATAMDPESQKGMPANGFPQGSPALEANGEFMNGNQMRGMPTGAPNGQNNNSNLALQDYQMQLMLLEQQNKKRLLMARQEQDSVTNGQGGPMPGQPGFVAPAMSPSNSRTGPSPNPDDQMKRGTPKMAPTGMPTNPDGSMAQGRGSPAPGQFDPSQMPPGMAPNMFQQMRMPGIMGPNGQIMPATSHPAFNGQMNGQMTPQQMEIMRRQGQAPNGPWQQGLPPGMMPGGQPQQPPNMTPQQRNAAMPPPPAPGPGEGSAQRTQPSSPSQSTAAPPTPSQTNKANPKGKKDAPKNNKVSLTRLFSGLVLHTDLIDRKPPERRVVRTQEVYQRQEANSPLHLHQDHPSHLPHLNSTRVPAVKGRTHNKYLLKTPCLHKHPMWIPCWEHFLGLTTMT